MIRSYCCVLCRRNNFFVFRQKQASCAYNQFRFLSFNPHAPEQHAPFLQPVPPIIVNRAAQAVALVDQFLKAGEPVALDVEGVNISRTGMLCTIQVATRSMAFLFDCTIPRLVESLAPLLQSDKILKISHDPREDSSNLYYEYGIMYRHVIDTQIALRKFEIQQNREPRDIGLQNALKQCLGIRLSKKAFIRKLMDTNPLLWIQRPLSKILIEYATQDVIYLHVLLSRLKRDLGDTIIKQVIEETAQQLCYRSLNESITDIDSVFQLGYQLDSIISTRVNSRVFLRANLGYGVVAVGKADSFHGCRLGDTVRCAVVGWNNKKTLYLEKCDTTLSPA